MITLETLSRADLDKLWPQAVDELMGFAQALEKSNATITAEQIRLAVQMANRYYTTLETTTKMEKSGSEGM